MFVHATCVQTCVPVNEKLILENRNNQLYIFLNFPVAAVWSATQVLDALNSDGRRADIILADVNLLMANDARMLRYIMQDDRLQHIPVFSK